MHIAVQLGLQGVVVANDRDVIRLKAMRTLIDRLGAANVVMLGQDASSLSLKLGLFDRVLADVPCSGDGTVRKSPRFFQIDEPPHRYEALSRVQRNILKRAMSLVKPGGRVVYSTCSLAPEEDEFVLDDVLRELGPEQVRVTSLHIPGLIASRGVTSWRGRELDPSVSGALRIWPHQQDTGGFFVAALERPLEAPI
jgi:16S rRNA C967 or C1407 C5-methylase (RsmB/RsmF family)